MGKESAYFSVCLCTDIDFVHTLGVGVSRFVLWLPSPFFSISGITVQPEAPQDKGQQ